MKKKKKQIYHKAHREIASGGKIPAPDVAIVLLRRALQRPTGTGG